jgi:hypothetical protein
MGQCTDAAIGVSVSLPLCYRYISLISKLLEIDNLRVYVSGLEENDDEIIDFIYDECEMIDLEILDELSEKTSEEEFNTTYKELNIKDNIIFHFIYVCATIYARNLSFRNRSNLFSNDTHIKSPIDLINDIQIGLNIFRDADIPEDLIKIGNTICDG